MPDRYTFYPRQDHTFDDLACGMLATSVADAVAHCDRTSRCVAFSLGGKDCSAQEPWRCGYCLKSTAARMGDRTLDGNFPNGCTGIFVRGECHPSPA